MARTDFVDDPSGENLLSKVNAADMNQIGSEINENTADITNLDGRVDTLEVAPPAHRHDWTDLDNVPSEFPPEPHTHSTADVTTLDTTLAQKVDTTSTPSRIYATDGTGAQTTLAFSSAATVSTIPTRGSGGTLAVGTPTSGEHATTKAYVDTADAAALDRANHTGTQSPSTIEGLTETVQDIVAEFLSEGTNVTLNYDDDGNLLTITAGGDGLDAEGVRDAIGVALQGVGLVSVVANDAGDTITISTTATANDTDANLKNRANHTGQQAASTISDFASAADARIAAATIAVSQLGTGKVVGSNNGTATSLTVWVGTEAQYSAIATKDANTLYFRTA